MGHIIPPCFEIGSSWVSFRTLAALLVWKKIRGLRESWKLKVPILSKRFEYEVVTVDGVFRMIAMVRSNTTPLGKMLWLM